MIDTVQLSSKVTFAHVSEASRTCSGRAPVWQKRDVALTYVLLQLYREVLHLHGRISHASQTHLACVSDVFGRYLVAELYCNHREKTEKYLDLAIKLQTLWNVRFEIKQLVFGTLGTLHETTIKSFKSLQLRDINVCQLIKTVLLKTAAILRGHLGLPSSS